MTAVAAVIEPPADLEGLLGVPRPGGGLALGTLATLFILPPVFAILAGRNTESPSLDPDDETSPLHEKSLKS